jgi:predicted Zn-ribbon and HTH transcriptional regulator
VARPAKAGRAKHDIADIVRAYRPALEAKLVLTPEQKRVLTDIAQCRTAKLGGHLDRCKQCGFERPSYNSCRNRHCPKCQSLAQEAWIEQQRARFLDVPHFHVVFTLPSELRSLTRFAPSTIFNMLFAAARSTLLELGENRLEGALLGATLVLHTWKRDLGFHPHIHAIVTGGGLVGGARWVPVHGFLFPIRMMSKLLRGKMLSGLRREYKKGAFEGFDAFDDPEGFDQLLSKIAKLKWNVHAQATLGKSSHVLDYLGRYTHRVGISNSRILDVTEDFVTFRTKGDGTTTVTGVEFLRRFVSHVLPNGFHKIRHIGLYASAHAKRLDRAAKLLGTPTRKRPPRRSWQERLLAHSGVDPSLCPRCAAPLVSLPLARASP